MSVIRHAISPYDFRVGAGGDPEIAPWIGDPVAPEVPNVGIDCVDCGELLLFDSGLNVVAVGFRVIYHYLQRIVGSSCHVLHTIP